ncbi:MAG: CPBP family intramembrane metalloprotease [Acidobacteria bacterium]|nr:MAG: CPBP family intramembrane metalloprotease [Acidobacteriota bacterium]
MAGEGVRETTGAAIAVVLVLQVASSLLVNAVVFQGSVVSALRRLHRATGGLIEPNVVANLVPLLVVVGFGVFLVARLRPADLGLSRAGLPPALAATAAFWLTLQIAFVLFGGGGVSLHPAWRDPGAGYVVGGVLGQLLGNALAEEAVFRGFLFPQLLLKMRHRLTGRTAFVLAALASQIVFAVLHLPNRLLVKGFELGPSLAADQARLVVHGLVFLALFLASRNLLVAVGVHALWNDPALLVASPGGVAHYLVVLGSSLALTAALALLRRRRSAAPLPAAAARRRTPPAIEE